MTSHRLLDVWLSAKENKTFFPFLLLLHSGQFLTLFLNFLSVWTFFFTFPVSAFFFLLLFLVPHFSKKLKLFKYLPLSLCLSLCLYLYLSISLCPKTILCSLLIFYNFFLLMRTMKLLFIVVMYNTPLRLNIFSILKKKKNFFN